jgi:hypothetical protein
VRVYELRVGDEDESMRVCAGFLDTVSALVVIIYPSMKCSVPNLPTYPSYSFLWSH